MIIDLTHYFTSRMPVYPNDPMPKLHPSAWIGKNGFNDFRMTTSMHVGTHIDGPLHMISGGKKLCEFQISHFFGRGVIVDGRGQSTITAKLLNTNEIRKNDIVLVRTGFSAFFGQQKYFDKYPEISENFAKKLIDTGIKILGLDTPSPDRSPFPIHKLLLKHDILIIENLTNLEKIPENAAFDIIALPMKLDTDSAPARVVALRRKGMLDFF